jgi:hypothetical protein
METKSILIPPIFMQIDGVTVELVEVSKHFLAPDQPYYIASVKIIYKGIHSRVFPIFAKDITDLKNKLKVEINKVKFIEYSCGLEEVKKLIC